MMRFFLFFILLSIHGYGQNPLIPFEFERHSPSYYQNALMKLDADFSSETEALEFYLAAYKLQRAHNPSDYFVAPNLERNLAKEYIIAFHTNEFSIGLIEFLESKGSREAALTLMESSTDLPEGAFYQYLAAKTLKEESAAKVALNKLEKAKLISPATKAFGVNAVRSAEGNSIMATQGFQDLLAVDYGLMKLDKQNARVLNHFLESLPTNISPTIKLELALDPTRIWISPTVSQAFYTEYAGGLWVEGIGLHWSQADGLDVVFAELKMEEIGKNFEGIGESPNTPADKGLIRSYVLFAEAYQNLANANEDKKQRAKATKLTQYIQQYLNE